MDLDVYKRQDLGPGGERLSVILQCDECQVVNSPLHIPVSYTHLDVYKRQVLGGSSQSSSINFHSVSDKPIFFMPFSPVQIPELVYICIPLLLSLIHI